MTWTPKTINLKLLFSDVINIRFNQEYEIIKVINLHVKLNLHDEFLEININEEFIRKKVYLVQKDQDI